MYSKPHNATNVTYLNPQSTDRDIDLTKTEVAMSSFIKYWVYTKAHNLGLLTGNGQKYSLCTLVIIPDIVNVLCNDIHLYMVFLK